MRKTLWSALALVMVLTLAGCGEQHRTDGSVTDSATYTPDAGYTLGNTDVVQLNGFRAIDIEWVSGQVNVELYDGEGIQLSETLADGSDVTLQMEWRVDEDDSELEIRSQPQLMSSTEEKILTVKLPRSMVLYGLDIDAVSAGVSVDLTDEDTLSLSELDVTSVSGAISVYAANAGEISLSTTSGSISGSVRTQKLEADSVSGSIDLALDIMPTELEAETSSGSMPLFTRASHSARSFSISAPPLPITIPGRAQWMLMRTLSAVLSISILGTPASYSFFFRNLRRL